MKRRSFMVQLARIMAGLSATYAFRSVDLSVDHAYDVYGGWTGKKFERSGFFRTEKEERWWMVTPEGNAYLSFGINHFHSGWWKQSYNKASWMKLLGVSEDEHLNVALRRWFLDTCQTYGFNGAGVHTDLNVLNSPNPQIPYVQAIPFVDISHWKNSVKDENFTDIFSEKFTKYCDQIAGEIAGSKRDDPFLLGYAMADCPLFTEEDCRDRPDTVYGGRRPSRIGWPRRLRNMAGSSAGKRAYVGLMAQLYAADIEAFNQTYSTTFPSFDALAMAENWRLESDLSNAWETRDNVEFLKICVDQYYRTAGEAIRRHDPNHLFFGDKLNGNTDTVDTLLKVTAKHTDVLFYQMYARYEVQRPSLDRWSERIDIPIINGDSAFTHIRKLLPKPYGPIAESEEINAEWTWEFFSQAFARPDFIGWHLCGLIDTPIHLVKKESDRQHSGLFDGFGKSYPKLKETIQRCGNQLYQIATK